MFDSQGAAPGKEQKQMAALGFTPVFDVLWLLSLKNGPWCVHSTLGEQAELPQR